MRIEKIADLRRSGGAYPIEVRVLRQWIPHNSPDKTCYVFIDKDASAIQVTGSEPDRFYIRNSLSVMGCYRISGYVCADPIASQSVVSHPISLKIGAAATIISIPDDNTIPRLYFELSNYKALYDIRDQSTHVADFIGTLEYIEDCFTKDRRPFVHVALNDISGKCVVATLWPDIITDPNRYNRAALEAAPNPSTVAVTSALVTTYGINIQLESTAATYTYLNPVSSSTASLIQRLNQLAAASGVKRNLALEFKRHRTLANLLSLTQEQSMGRSFICEAVISDFQHLKPWFTTKCQFCSQDAHPNGSAWACPSHGIIEIPIHLFRIHVIIADETASANATAADTPVAALIHKDCSTIVITEGYTDPNIIPPPLLAVIGVPKKMSLRMQRDKFGSATFFIHGFDDIQPKQPTDTTDGSNPITPPTPAQKMTPTITTTTTSAKRGLQMQTDANTSSRKEPRT